MEKCSARYITDAEKRGEKNLLTTLRSIWFQSCLHLGTLLHSFIFQSWVKHVPCSEIKSHVKVLNLDRACSHDFLDVVIFNQQHVCQRILFKCSNKVVHPTCRLPIGPLERVLNCLWIDRILYYFWQISVNGLKQFEACRHSRAENEFHMEYRIMQFPLQSPSLSSLQLWQSYAENVLH